MNEINEDIRNLWDYLCIGTEPVNSDFIIGLGSILTLVPKRCAELLNQGLADFIIFSGNCGKGTKGVISISEADRFKAIAIDDGAPEEKILTESRATTTYENMKYIIRTLKERNLNPNSFLIVGKPYQERRARAIADIDLVGKDYRVVSLGMTLEEYFSFVENDELMSIQDAINEMVGEISLMIKAPKFGLQSEQEIPSEVIDSFNRLIELGYDRYNYTDDTVRSFIPKNLTSEREEM